MPTRYGRSPWIDRFPKSRVPSYPRHRGPLNIDVAIVGGGLTGCATAYAFAAAGVKVAMFEADGIGRGSSGSSGGVIADDPGASFLEAEKMLGLRKARLAWRAWHRAALDFTALIRRLDIPCHLEPQSTLMTAITPDAATRLKREQKLRKDAGLDVPLINPRAASAESGLAVAAAVRHRDGATLDPYRAGVGLAAAARARGALLFENSPVQKITFTRKWADLFTAGGTIRTNHVIVATGVPTPLFKSLARHFWFKKTYLTLTEAVPARVRQKLGPRTAIVRDLAAPPHVVRWVDDARLLIAGADGDAAPDRLRHQTIFQRTGQLMYELSTMYPEISGLMPAYGWDAAYVRTAEGLPYIGPHRNFPHHLFAFGDSSHSVTGAYLASRVLLRHYLDKPEPSDEAFEFTR